MSSETYIHRSQQIDSTMKAPVPWVCLHLYVDTHDEDAVTKIASNQEIIQKLKKNKILRTYSRIVIIGYNPNELECCVDLTQLGNIIGENTQLKGLGFTDFKGNELNSLIDNSFCSGMSTNKSIKYIGFDQTLNGKFVSALLPFFENNNKLEKVQFSSKVYKGDSSAGIEQAVSRCNNSLKQLCLWNEFCSFNWRVVLLALKNHPQLEVLQLCGCGNRLRAMDIEALGGFLQIASRLKSLQIKTKSLDNDGLRILISVLMDGTKLLPLRSLVLSDNEFDGGLGALAEVVKHIRSLKHLDLSQNNITKTEWQHISTALACPESNLKELCIRNCGIDNEIIRILAASLTHNEKLKRLDMRYNNITQEGWDAFIQLLCNTSSLESTFNSNHTLSYLGDGINHDATLPQIKSLLEINRDCGRKEAAVRKILKSNPNLDLTPLLRWEAQLKQEFGEEHGHERGLITLPYVISWLQRADGYLYHYLNRENGFEGILKRRRLNKGMEEDFELRKLNALYDSFRWNGKVYFPY